MFRMHVPDIAAFTEAGHKPGETVICTGKIKHVGSTYVDQWNYLKGILPKDRVGEAKLTLAAPNWVRKHPEVIIFMIQIYPRV